jgi:hypothetical protein
MTDTQRAQAERIGDALADSPWKCYLAEACARKPIVIAMLFAHGLFLPLNLWRAVEVEKPDWNLM